MKRLRRAHGNTMETRMTIQVDRKTGLEVAQMFCGGCTLDRTSSTTGHRCCAWSIMSKHSLKLSRQETAEWTRSSLG